VKTTKPSPRTVGPTEIQAPVPETAGSVEGWLYEDKI